MIGRFSRLLEALHAPEGSTSDWLERVARAADSTFRRGLGCIAYLYDLEQRPDARILSSAIAGLDAPSNAAHELCTAIHAEQSKDALLRIYQPPSRIASMLPDEFGFERVGPAWSQLFDLGPVLDAVVLHGGVRVERGCLIAVHAPRRERVSAHTQAEFERLAAHVRVAHQLRFFEPPIEEPPRGEVVLGSRGELLDAPMDPRDTAAVALFRRLVRDTEARRRKLRSFSAQESAAIWDELLRQGVRVREHQDSDGRRMTLFRMPSDAHVKPLGDLSPTEILILRGLAEGLSNKVIAHDVGLPMSTVATHIHRLSEKLGARSRFELISIAQTRAAQHPSTLE